MKDEIGLTYSMHEIEEKYKVLVKNQTAKDHLEDVGEDGKTVLK
jgi:hypothetical protein